MAAKCHIPPENTKEYEDYIREIDDIEQAKESSDTDDPSTDEELCKTPDEGEQELNWLNDAGYGHLASTIQEGKELPEEVLINETLSLTKAQAAAIKKRVDTLNATVRKRQKQQHKTDVRDVFSQQQQAADNFSTVLQTKKTNKKDREVSLLSKNRGGYYMTGDGNVDDSTVAGVEIISLQSKSTSGSQASAAEPSFLDGNPAIPPTFIRDTTAKERLDTNGLPSYHIQKDVLGITRVSDLSKMDLVKIRSLAFLEVTSLFDTHNITYSKRKSKKRYKDHGVFGVPLQTLLEHDQKKKPCKVPRIFMDLISFLEEQGIQEEGILRIPGSASRIKALRKEIEEKYNHNTFSWKVVRPNDAAGLLKQFIRELPVPLLTFEYLEAFAAVEGIADNEHQLQALHLLILCLPEVHRDTLKMLLHFLQLIVSSPNNKMNLVNVSMIMAPNLFLVANARSRSKSKSSSPEIEIRMAAGTANIVRLLIHYQDLLWTVPASMVQQIRHQYETEHQRKSKDKSLMKFLGKKDKSDPYKKPSILNEKDYREGVIKVHAPHLGKSVTPIKLQPETLVRTIIQEFQQKTIENDKQDKLINGRKGGSGNDFDERSKVDNMYLYEIGGNIGARQLDNDTNMLALLTVNPNADWVIQINNP